MLDPPITCGAIGQREGVYFMCTLPAGHGGEHVAERTTDRYRLHIWRDGEEASETDRAPVEPLRETLAGLSADREDRAPPPVPIWRGLQQELSDVKAVLVSGGRPAQPEQSLTEIMAALTAIEAEGVRLAMQWRPKASASEILATGEMFARHIRRRLRLPEPSE